MSHTKQKVLALLSEAPTKSMIIGHYDVEHYTAQELADELGAKRSAIMAAIASIKRDGVPVIGERSYNSLHDRKDYVYSIKAEYLLKGLIL